MPLLSIVTIMFNAREGFLDTADSLVSSMPNWCEWVVVDGGSSDGSQEEAERLAPHIARYLSEPDDGIADAFNKGIRMCSGRYVLFLNAGDRALPDLFESARALMEMAPPAPAIIGQITMDGRRIGRPVNFRRQLCRNYLPHQASLLRRDLFETLGYLDTSYRLGMDYEWSLRLQPLWQNIRFIDKPLADMEPGGTSITNYRDTYAAYHRARHKHGHSWLASKLAEHYFVLKVTLGRILRRYLPKRG